MRSAALDKSGGPLVAQSGINTFIAKVDSSFGYVKAIDLKSTSNPYYSDLATDASGNVYIAATLDATFDFGGGNTLTSFGGNDVFVAKLDPTLTHVWSKRFGDGLNQIANGIGVDPNGRLGVAGAYKGTINFGKGALPNAPQGWGMFFATFDSNGNVLASFGSGSSQGTGCDANAARYHTGSDFVIAGSFGVECQLPSQKLMGGGAYVARLSP